MLHQSKNPQHPYYESAKQSQRLHFSNQPDMSFRERFRVAQLKGHFHAV